MSFARVSFSARLMPVKPVTTVTVFPPRCAVWRMISTRPRFFFGEGGAVSTVVTVGLPAGVRGRFRLFRVANGLSHGMGSPLVGRRFLSFNATPALSSRWSGRLFQERQLQLYRMLSIRHPDLSFLNGALQLHAGHSQLS